MKFQTIIPAPHNNPTAHDTVYPGIISFSHAHTAYASCIVIFNLGPGMAETWLCNSMHDIETLREYYLLERQLPKSNHLFTVCKLHYVQYGMLMANPWDACSASVRKVIEEDIAALEEINGQILMRKLGFDGAQEPNGDFTATFVASDAEDWEGKHADDDYDGDDDDDYNGYFEDDYGYYDDEGHDDEQDSEED